MLANSILNITPLLYKSQPDNNPSKFSFSKAASLQPISKHIFELLLQSNYEHSSSKLFSALQMLSIF